MEKEFDCGNIYLTGEMEGEEQAMQSPSKLGFHLLESLQRKAGDKKSITILFGLLLLSFVLWIILFSVMHSDYSKMSSEMKREQADLSELTTKYFQMLSVLKGFKKDSAANVSQQLEQLQVEQEKMRDVLQKLLTKTYEPPKCGEKWVQFQNSCYYFSSSSKTWKDARKYCMDNDADLVVVNNQEEQSYINKKTGSTRRWLGLHDTEKEGEWIWVDQSPLTFTAWSEGEPNDADALRGEDCVEVIGYGTWNDGPCTLPQNWICEKSMSSPI
ncbi:CD209 antigen-like protein C isoform X1 [Rhinatrema bivittatum]|uniref:CD209 antigen-like protein C isoform X1 n=1 Tax=Rhinatrema bivittatum TaxID=194408 RepID=UPI001125C742|nr:CD209 antigen-like protein C isoform X1 [Rhinatrema bivittatum]